jgi:predicted phage-related endonuclease
MTNNCDLSGNNLVRLLLEERRQLKKMIDQLEQGQKRWKEINDSLKEMMGEATVATLPGWRLEIKTQKRREYTIPAQEVKRLFVQWDDADNEKGSVSN